MVAQSSGSKNMEAAGSKFDEKSKFEKMRSRPSSARDQLGTCNTGLFAELRASCASFRLNPSLEDQARSDVTTGCRSTLSVATTRRLLSLKSSNGEAHDLGTGNSCRLLVDRFPRADETSDFVTTTTCRLTVD